MANDSRGKRQQMSPRQAVPSGLPTPSAHPEPEMRRWPHPVVSAPQDAAPQNLPAALHYIQCSLSYQNQLLSEIKTLLETLAAPAEGEERK